MIVLGRDRVQTDQDRHFVRVPCTWQRGGRRLRGGPYGCTYRLHYGAAPPPCVREAWHGGRIPLPSTSTMRNGGWIHVRGLFGAAWWKRVCNHANICPYRSLPCVASARTARAQQKSVVRVLHRSDQIKFSRPLDTGRSVKSGSPVPGCNRTSLNTEQGAGPGAWNSGPTVLDSLNDRVGLARGSWRETQRLDTTRHYYTNT